MGVSNVRILVVDGGGTKTEAVVFEDLKEIFRKTSGPSNPLSVGLENMLNSIEDALDGIEKTFEVAVFGLAGVGFSEELRDEVESVLESRVNSKRTVVLSDMHLSTVGALGGEDGIVVIAGTGSVVVGFKDWRFEKVGGWGYLLGDEGSGYRLSLDSLRYALKYFEGRERESLLLEGLKSRFGISSASDVINLVYVEKIPRNELASFSTHFLNAVSRGDEVARKILESNISELIDCVLYLRKKLSVSKISYSGGMFRSKIYREFFESMLRREGLSLTESVTSPTVGGLLIALRELGMNEKIRDLSWISEI